MPERLRISAIHSDHFTPSPVVDDGVVVGDSVLPNRHFECLTERELEVLKPLALGYSAKQVAGQLFLSSKAIDSRKYRIMKKLGIHDRVHLCRYAIRQGLIQP